MEREVASCVSSDPSSSEWSWSSSTGAAARAEGGDEDNDDDESISLCLSSLSGDSYHTLGKINKLRFDRSHLYGREAECERLLQIYNRVALGGSGSDSSINHTVLVAGVPGCGKSMFVRETLRDHTTSAHDGYFVSGKYQQYRLKDEPYSALAAALTDLVELYMQAEDSALIRDRALVRLTKEDVRELSTTLISNLWKFLYPDEAPVEFDDERHDCDSGASQSGDTVINWGPAFTRFKLICCKFLSSVACREHPLIIFLDDLQWQDAASRDLLPALMKDDSLKHILWVGAFRSADDLSELRSSSRQTLIQLQNLPLKPLHEMIRRTLQQKNCRVTMAMGKIVEEDEEKQTEEEEMFYENDPELLQLSELVWNRTNGNPLVVVHFLQSLVGRGMLIEQHRQSGWTWDMGEIKSRTNVCHNVVPLLESRIQTLKGKAILAIAALLGYRFQLEMLTEIVFQVASNESRQQHGDDNDASIPPPPPIPALKKRVKWILLLAEQNSLIESCCDGTSVAYKFTHDRIQQCFYEIQTEEQRTQLHVKIGQYFASQLVIDNTILNGGAAPVRYRQEDSLLCLVVDQLERGSCHLQSLEDRAKAAELAYRAGKLSMKKSSFKTSRAYLRTAMEWLHQELGMEWVTHYSLTLQVFSTAAEAEFAIGQFDACRKLVEEILKHSRSLSDKMRAYYIMVVSLGARGRLEEAIQVSVSVLQLLGERFPKTSNMAHVILEGSRTRRALRRMSDDDILGLPRMTSQTKLHAIELMSMTVESSRLLASRGEKGFHFVTMGLRMIRLTLKYGLSRFASHGFACMGEFCSVMGNAKGATEYGRLALKLLELFPHAKAAEARTQCLLHHSVMHWSMHIQDHCAAFRNIYVVGMRVGELDVAYMGFTGFMVVLLAAGRPLAEIDKHYNTSLKQMKAFNMENSIHLNAHSHQRCQNLMGLNRDPVVLTGNIMDESETIRWLEESGNFVALMVLYFTKLDLALHFEAYNIVEELLPQLESRRYVLSGHISQYAISYTLGQAYLRLYRKTGKRQYKKRGLGVIKTLEGWKKAGSSHCDDILALLHAEVVSQEQRNNAGGCKAVQDAWDVCIKLHEDSGNLPRLGIANERAAGVFRERNAYDIAARYAIEAIDVFERWDADAKVKFLKRKYHDIMPKQPSAEEEAKQVAPFIEELY